MKTSVSMGASPAESQLALHLLGWKAFQDLCVTVAEECLQRPVQMFLPGNDAGRDGAFIGRWEGASPSAGESTIQCKFTSKQDKNLTVSLLSDEIEKARLLAAGGRANDYIILTNHPVTGAMELQIAAAFEAVGVGKCRVFGSDWLQLQIRKSPRLRMMVPRLYGLGDLADILDERAYDQAKLILSSMGDDLQRLVVTEAHRRSVRAISKHNVVLLLGAPAAGKSTIGASLAIGAADIWKSMPVRATSPADITARLKPGAPQFFWIDDAWGGQQYQRGKVDAWNQVFPLMQASVKKGARFLITSRDYIWRAAQKDLKLSAFPILKESQVIINVHELSVQEKAQILYNHIKLGDQPTEFRTAIKPILPEVAEMKAFLPETARRIGSAFFASRVVPARASVVAYFEKPQDHLVETVQGLAPDCKAAVATIFLNGGAVASPIRAELFGAASEAFGVPLADIRAQVENLDGSLLLRAENEQGYYWTYKHPTVSDAFANYLRSSPELVELYLRGAKLESILAEVISPSMSVYGSAVVVPDSLAPLLAERLKHADASALVNFLSYRSNLVVTRMVMALRPELLERLRNFSFPMSEDRNADFAARLYAFGLLPPEWRLHVAKRIARGAVEDADASFLTDEDLGDILTEEERVELLADVETQVLSDPDEFVSRARDEWDTDYDPEDHFDILERHIKYFVEALSPQRDYAAVLERVKSDIRSEVRSMRERYQSGSSTSAPISSSTPATTGLSNLFRDVDE